MAETKAEKAERKAEEKEAAEERSYMDVKFKGMPILEKPKPIKPIPPATNRGR